MNEEQIAIVGSGTVGRSWAAIFARAEYKVLLYDIDEKMLSVALLDIKDKLKELQHYGLLNGQNIDDISSRISTSQNTADLSSACYIQECTPENVELKIKVFAMLEENCNANAILASSTSCILPSLFSENLSTRQNVIVAHPINPPHFIPCVEVVPSPWTSDDIAKKTCDIMKKIGQKPVQLKKELDGFLVNRLQYALLQESYRLVDSGHATPQDIDDAISNGLALRWSFMGPFETIHLNAPKGTSDYFERYAEGIHRVCESMGPNVKMEGETVKRIASVMDEKIPVDDLSKAIDWRNSRLAALCVHKKDQELKDSKEK